MQYFAWFLCFTAVTGAPLSNTLSAKNLIAIDPSTETCIGATATSECRTASQAAPNLAASFKMFGIQDFNTQAALVALIMYESGSFKYSQNHYPGVPGQGTRNMQSPAYNLQYARFLANNVKGSGVTSSDVDKAQAQGPAATLRIVNTDLWSFASASWFLVTQCAQEVRNGVFQGTQAGWTDYLTQCVGTTATDDRTLIWQKTKSLGQWSS